MTSPLGHFMDELLRDHMKKQMRIQRRDEVVIIDDNAHMTQDNRLMNSRIFSRTCSSSSSSSHLANRWSSEPTTTSRQSSISPVSAIKSNRSLAPPAEQQLSENEYSASICENIAKTTPSCTLFSDDSSPRMVMFMDNRSPKKSLELEAPQLPRRFLSPQGLKQGIACNLVDRLEIDSKCMFLDDAVSTSVCPFLLLKRHSMTTFDIMDRAIPVCSLLTS